MDCIQDTSKTHTGSDGNLHVQARTNDDEPEMEDRRMVSGEEATLPGDTAIYDGIMGQGDSNRDNADTDAGHQEDTPGGTQRNDHAGNQNTDAVETTEPSHPRTSNEDTESRQEQTN